MSKKIEWPAHFIRPQAPVPGAEEETIKGVAHTNTVGESYPPEPKSIFASYLDLFKIRVTAMVVLNAWAGFCLAAHKTGASLISWRWLSALTGVGLCCAGAAALNQVLEREADRRMTRTKDRPLPAGRITVWQAQVAGWATLAAGAALLGGVNHPLTGAMGLATALFYAFVYTPLKTKTPHATLVGAFPGAMPPVLGWMAVTGRFEREELALFAIVFLWQFPHFLAIAWLYREDYERAGIRMLPVIDASGRATVRQILGYSAVLVPVSLWPFFLGLGGWVYLAGALALSLGYLFFGIRLALLRLPPSAAHSKREARALLRASVIYLPLLLGLLVLNGVWR